MNKALNNAPNYKNTKSVYISHSHSDHLMDVPYIHQFLLWSSPFIYGSSSTKTLLNNVNTLTGKVKQLNKYNLNINHICVTPILSGHAPHAKFVLPINFVSENVKELNNFNDPIG